MHWPGEKQDRINGWIVLVGGVIMLIAGIATLTRGDTTWGVLLGIVGLGGLSNSLWHFGVLGPDPSARDGD